MHELLLGLRGLRTLMLKNCLLHDGCSPGLCDILTSCTTLEKLYIGGNIFGMVGLAHIFQHLQRHPSLIMLGVQQNWNGNHARPEAVEALCKLITLTPALRSIRMHNSMILCADSSAEDLRNVCAALYGRAIQMHAIHLAGVDVSELWRRKDLPDIYGLNFQSHSILPEHMLRLAQREIAVLMAQHSRLGARSWLHILDENMLQMICRDFAGAL